MSTKPRLPDLARRLLTVSLRINAAHTIALRLQQSARRSILRDQNHKQYDDLRRALLTWVTEKFGRITAAHHFPGGGSADKQANESAALRDLEALGFLTQFDGHLKVELPPYQWSIDKSRVVWDAPPIRALAMADGCAQDLSASFRFFIWDLKKGSQGNIAELHLPVSNTKAIEGSNRAEIWAFKRDYLWFNSVALFDSLTQLFQGFCDEVQKLRDVGEPASPRWRCFVREYAEPSSDLRARTFTGLQIELAQIVRTEIVHSEAAGGAISPLPLETLVPPGTNPVRSGLLHGTPPKFDALVAAVRSAGAHIGTDRGLIEILIPARDMLQSYFPGRTGEPIWGVDAESDAPEIWGLWLKAQGREAIVTPFESSPGEALPAPAGPSVRLSDRTVISFLDLQHEIDPTEKTVPTAEGKERKLVVTPQLRKNAAIIMIHGMEGGSLEDGLIKKARDHGAPIIEVSGGVTTKYPNGGFPLLGNASQVKRMVSMKWEKFELDEDVPVEEFVRRLRGG